MERVVVSLLHVQLVVMDNNVLMEVLSQEELDQVASINTTANANAQPDSPAQIAKSQPNAELDIIIYHAKTEAHHWNMVVQMEGIGIFGQNIIVGVCMENVHVF